MKQRRNFFRVLHHEGRTLPSVLVLDSVDLRLGEEGFICYQYLIKAIELDID